MLLRSSSLKGGLLLLLTTILAAASILKRSNNDGFEQSPNLQVQKGSLHQANDREILKGKCLLDKTQTSPVPTILISRGRSGSAVTWQLMGALTGEETKSDEYTGGSSKNYQLFFQNHTDETWLIDVLCQKRKDFPNAGVVGFKWKPIEPGIFLSAPGSLAALRYLSKNHHVKVIRSRRNVLDVKISEYKHLLAKESNKIHTLESHCERDDYNCQQQHLSFSSGIKLPTSNLVHNLEWMTKNEDDIDNLLVEMGVPHVAVTYERLYGGGDTAVAEWKRIFDFLGRGPQKLTIEILDGAMHQSVTHHASHKETLGNYEEVRDLLTGTKFENLLH